MRNKITEKTFREAIARLSGTDDGRILLAWLSSFCFHTGTALDAGSVEKTYANAAVQNVYRSIRAFVPAEDLRKIEFDYVLSNEGAKDGSSKQ